jgi:antitoxin ParD1/3/4
MTLELSPHHEHFINAQVASGRFATAEDVIQSALELLEEREAVRSEKQRLWDEAIEKGYQQYLRGDVVSGSIDEIFARARKLSGIADAD